MDNLMEMSTEELNLFSELIYKYTAIKIGENKKSLLINRLRPRLIENKMTSYKDYYNFLKKGGASPAEIQNFIDAVTTNETYFYRAPKIWEFFSESYLKTWYDKKTLALLKLWCAAASSGEEPYTIAMICEDFADKNKGFSYSLEASDISHKMLKKCREASYKGRSIEKVPALFLKKYFETTDNENYSIKKNIQKKIKFFEHNLLSKPNLKDLDLIFLRNVLIYFDNETKELILKHMHQALKPGGLLIVGESEGLINTKSGFVYVKPSIFLKKE